MQLNGSSGSWWRRTRQRHNLWPPLVADLFNPTQTTATTAVVSGRKADKLDLWSVGFALYAPGCLEVFPYSCIQMFVSSWGDHHETPRPNWRSWNARKSDAGWWMWLNSDVCMYLQINVFLTGLGNSFHSFCRCHGHCGTTSGFPHTWNRQGPGTGGSFHQLVSKVAANAVEQPINIRRNTPLGDSRSLEPLEPLEQSTALS